MLCLFIFYFLIFCCGCMGVMGCLLYVVDFLVFLLVGWLVQLGGFVGGGFHSSPL